jgi:hypothetical protein
MNTHELKTIPIYFNEVASGVKNFVLRKNDRDFVIGDELILREWSYGMGYSGAQIHARIIYILGGIEGFTFGLQRGYCVLGIEVKR